MTKTNDASDTKVKYSSDLLDFFTERSARSHAKFFLNHLRPGMNLLDCGCGPGSITVDLAEIVAPGQVTGIDIEPAQIEIAKSLQFKRNVLKVRFVVGDINELPFSEESFDAVFVHGVVEYLNDPVQAFKEIYRVLKKDGVLGARHADYGGFLLAPANRDVELFLELFGRLITHNGGDLHCGRNQVSYIRKAGFTQVKQSASYDCWTTHPETTLKIAEYMAGYIISP